MTDSFVVRAVVLLLGAFALIGLAGLIFLVWSGTAGSDLAIVGGPTGVALGALGALLVSTRVGPTPPPAG